MKEIPPKGDLKEYSLPKILVSLNRKKVTGTLKISTELFTKNLYMIKGEVIYASSTYEDDRLGEMLLKAGKINLQQYEKSVELLKSTKKRQGAILVELGYITPKDLFWGVKYQVREIIYSLFQLERGEFEFVEDDLPGEDIITLKMSLGELIYEGVKRINNWTRIQREMPSMDTVLKLTNDPLSLFQEVKLDENDKAVLSLVDGKRTIKDILNTSSIGSFEALKTLYVLYSIGILEESKDSEPVTISVEELMEELDEEERQFMQELNELYEQLPKLTPYQLLGVSPDDDEQSIKRSYYRLAKRYHPDRYYSSGREEIKEKLTVIFDAITKAFEQIKNEKTQVVEEPVKAEEQEEIKPVPPEQRARQQFMRGVKELREGNYWGAAEALRWATRLDSKQDKYWYHLSLALRHIPKRLKQAEEAMLEALRLNPFKADYYVELGQIYLAAGLKKRAKTQFEKALKLDPTHSEAMNALHSL